MRHHEAPGPITAPGVHTGRSRCPGRVGACRALAAPLLLLLAAGLGACSGAAAGDPVLSAVEPASGYFKVATPIVIRGERLYARAQVDLGSGQAQLDASFLASLGSTPLQELRFVDARTLQALVPAGMALGAYTLTVTTPAGRTVTLPDAFRVVDQPAGVPISIEDAPGGSGSRVDGLSFTAGDTLQVFAVLRDYQGAYVEDIAVSWSVTGGIGLIPAGPAVSATLALTTAGVGAVVGTREPALPGQSGYLVVGPAALWRVYIETLPGGLGEEVGNTDLTSDQSLNLFSIGRDEYGNFVESRSVLWQAEPGLGELDAGPSIANVFQPSRLGSGRITISGEGFYGDQTGLISVVAGALASIRIDNAPDGTGSPIGPTTLTAGDQLRLYAIGLDAIGNVAGGVAASWALSDGASIGELSVRDGTSTVFVASSPGQGQVLAVFDGLSASAGPLTVRPGSVVAVTIDDAPGGNPVGARSLAVGTTLDLYASGRDARGFYVTDVACTWTVVGDIGLVQPGPSSQTRFSAKRTGQGHVRCAPRADALAPVETGLLTVSTGVPVAVRILTDPGGQPTDAATELPAGSVLGLRAWGVDVEGNPIAPLAVDWRFEPAPPLGSLDPAAGTDRSTLTLTRAGQARVIADPVESGSLARGQTGLITVQPGLLTRLSVEDAAAGAGQALGDQVVLVPLSLALYSIGRDAWGNFVGQQPAAWSFVDVSAGSPGAFDPASGLHDSVTYDTTSADDGTSFKIRLDDGSRLGTSGPLLVRDAAIDSLRIETAAGGNQPALGDASLTADQSLTLYVAAYAGPTFIANLSLGVSWGLASGTAGLGGFTPHGSATLFDAQRVGSGVLRASYAGYHDDSGTITVTAGALAVAQIEDAPGGAGAALVTLTLSADQEVALYGVGRDTDGNYVAAASGTWSDPYGLGSLSPSSGSSTTFDAARVGQGLIVLDPAGGGLPQAATAVTVTPGALAALAIESQEDGLGQRLEGVALNVTADDRYTWYAVGRDADGNYIGLLAASWSLLSPGNVPIATLAPTAASGWTLVDFVRPGTDRVRASTSGGGGPTLTSTTGDITVTPGALALVRIEDQPGGAGQVVGDRTLSADQTLTLYAVGRDADGNLVSDVAVDWQAAPSTLGTLSPASNASSSLFSAATVGKGSLSIYPPAPTPGTSTGAITVTHGALSYFSLDPIASPKSAGVPFAIAVQARDADANLVLSFGERVALSDTSTTLTPSLSASFGLGQLSQNVQVASPWTSDTITVRHVATNKIGSSNAFDVLAVATPALAISLAASPTLLFDGQELLVSAVIANVGGVTLDEITPAAPSGTTQRCSASLGATGTNAGKLDCLAGPTPPTIESLDPAAQATISWRLRPQRGGTGRIDLSLLVNATRADSGQAYSSSAVSFGPLWLSPSTCLLNPPFADAGNELRGSCQQLLGSSDSYRVGGDPTASGGVAPYDYAWTPSRLFDGANTANPQLRTDEALSTLSLDLLVTDDYDCLAAAQTTLRIESPLISSLQLSPNPICAGGGTVTAMVTAANSWSGTCYRYDWGDGAVDWSSSASAGHVYSSSPGGGHIPVRVDVYGGCAGACSDSACPDCFASATAILYRAASGLPAGSYEFSFDDDTGPGIECINGPRLNLVSREPVRDCAGSILGAGRTFTVFATRGLPQADELPASGGVQVSTSADGRLRVRLCPSGLGGPGVLYARSLAGAAAGSYVFDAPASYLPVLMRVAAFGPAGLSSIPPPYFKARFDRAVNCDTLSGSSVFLERVDAAGGDLPVPATVACAPPDEVYLVPQEPLELGAGVSYEVTLLGSIQDLLGHPLDANMDGSYSFGERFTWRFGSGNAGLIGISCGSPQPSSISPDGDGLADTAALLFTITGTGLGTVTVLVGVRDERGLLRRTLSKRYTIFNLTSLEWDGRGDDGLVLPPGQYRWSAVAYDDLSRSASCIGAPIQLTWPFVP